MPLWSACPQFILKAAEPFQKQRGESMAGRNDYMRGKVDEIEMKK